MKTIILKCPKYGRFHFGKLGLDENSSLAQSSEIIHSDTLFSALINVCSRICDEDTVKSLITAFDTKQIKISSAFYCLQIDNFNKDNSRISTKQVFFLPKPDYFELLNSDLENRKTYSKIAFVSKGIWSKGYLPSQWNKENDCIIIDKKFVLLKSELDDDYIQLTQDIDNDVPELSIKIFYSKTNPKIADHKRRWDNNIFFQTDLLLTQTSFYYQIKTQRVLRKTIQPNFYFFLDIDNNCKYKNLIYSVLKILADEGIGGAISTGCGKLEEVDIIDEDFSWDFENGKAHPELKVSASLISPENQDVLQKLYRYKILTRGGRPISKDRVSLKRIRMIKEGAIVSSGIDGGLPQIHALEYFRYGKTFTIPIHENCIKDEFLQKN